MTRPLMPSVAAVAARAAGAAPDYAANLAAFLQAETGSVCGRWNGRMSASEQRALFGRYLGKGTLAIDGARETLEHWVKVAFGLDVDCTAGFHWRDL
jgi:hypothetical protein